MSIQYPFSSIRLVISDVDGTLLDSQHHLGEITRDILMKCREKGLPFTIATGKNWVSAKSLVEKLPIQIPMILANGAIISDPHGLHSRS
jgi:HAD superfamily hydrolase (TIGR01484 family)